MPGFRMRCRATPRQALLAAGVVALTMAGCAHRDRSSPAEIAVPRLYFQPTQGQIAGRQERDRYECYLWARQQTRFDPSNPKLAVHQRLELVAAAGPAPPAPMTGKSDPAQKRHPSAADRAASSYRRAITACLEGRGYVVHE